MEMTVSISTAATRSTIVRPRIRRRTPNTIPKKIRIAATKRKKSAKSLLQICFERAGDYARGVVWIDGFHVEPMDEQHIVFDVDYQRSRRQRDRIGKRQRAMGTSQPGLDLDDTRRDIDARSVNITHHVDIGAYKFDGEHAGVPNKMIEARGRELNPLPNAGLLRKYERQCR